MAVEAAFFAKLSKPIAAFLLSRYLGSPADTIGAELADFAALRFQRLVDQREAARLFERIGDRVVEHLLPLFHDAPHDRINSNAVAHQVSLTLSAGISAKSIVKHDLDPDEITRNLLMTQPVPDGHYSADELDLYERALGHAIRYVVEISARLPRFDVELAGENLSRLTALGSVIEQTLNTVQRIEQHVLSASAERIHLRYESDYRQAVVRNLDYLELFGADISFEMVRYSLSVAYISLHFESAAGANGEGQILPAESLLDQLDDSRGRLLVRGEAGSGKSTFLRWIAIQAAGVQIPESPSQTGSGDEFFSAEDRSLAAKRFSRHLYHRKQTYTVNNWRFKIPFLIRLRDCKDGCLPSPEDLPESIASEIGRPREEWLLPVLRRGAAIILIDGADEVRGTSRIDVHQQIKSLVGQYPNNYYVVTTRPTAVPPNWLKVAGFAEARINPLSDLDKSRFIDKWHDAVEEQLRQYGKPSNLKALSQALKDHLSEVPSISRLARNPLLCAMICALHRDRNQKLPQSLSELMEALCHMLLHRRDRESGLPLEQLSAVYVKLSYEQKRSIVQDVAYDMVLNEASTISYTRVVEITKKNVVAFGDLRHIDPASIVDGLIERSGIIRETRPKVLDFVHNAFKEFLAAERFVEDDRVALLAKNALDPLWRRVVLFALACRNKTFATGVVSKVIGLSGVQPSRELQVFLVECKAYALHLEPRFRQYIDALEERLFPPRSSDDAEALAAAGESVLRFLAYKPMAAVEAAACIRTLRSIGTPKAYQCLRGYLVDERPAVVEELAQAINPLEIPSVRNVVISGRSLPVGIASQIADLQPLCDHGPVGVLKLNNTQVSDLEAIRDVKGVVELDLSGTRIEDVKPLSSHKGLRRLNLSETRVRDLTPLQGLCELEWLDISGCPVSTLAPLKHLVALREINISLTNISSLMHLGRLPALKYVNTWGSQVTDPGRLRDRTDVVIDGL